MSDDPDEVQVDTTRPPSLVDALIPVIVLIFLLILSIVIFGIDSFTGPLQVSLLMSAVVAGLIAMKNGHTSARIRDAAIGGVSSAMGAIFILLAVGALIGTWNMSGTIPTVVSYGIAVLRPSIFYFTVALVCGVVGLVTGSSWTTAGTLGVAFVGMAPILGMDTAICAGAVISGAYMGDKMTPLSETTVLVPSLVGGVTVGQHVRGMMTTVIPSFGLALIGFLIVGIVEDPKPTTMEVSTARDVLALAYNISPINLLPLALLVYFSIRKVPAFLSIFLVALFSGVMACFTQSGAVSAFVDDPDHGFVLDRIEAVYTAMANGFTSSSGNATIDGLFSGGGMSAMLLTVWLILSALAFAAIMEDAGFLNRLIEPIVHRAHSDAALISAVAATSAGLNVVAGDQYVAVVLPSRVYRSVFRERGLAPRMLSRTVEDTGTVTSVLVPWNSCGAYMTGVLGVPTMKYLPYAFFNILNPIIALTFAFVGYRVEHLTRATPISPEPDRSAPVEPPQGEIDVQ